MCHGEENVVWEFTEKFTPMQTTIPPAIGIARAALYNRNVMQTTQVILTILVVTLKKETGEIKFNNALYFT